MNNGFPDTGHQAVTRERQVADKESPETVLADCLESFQAVAKVGGGRAEPRGLLSGRDGAPVQGEQSGESWQQRVCKRRAAQRELQRWAEALQVSTGGLTSRCW